MALESPFARKKDRQQSLKKGLKKGRQEGLQEGLQEGVRVGVIQSEQRVLIVIVEKSLDRTLSDKERARLLELHERLGFDRLHDECFERRGPALIQWFKNSKAV